MHWYENQMRINIDVILLGEYRNWNAEDQVKIIEQQPIKQAMAVIQVFTNVDTSSQLCRILLATWFITL